tara:strand:+ start:1666 stop:1851 length:186 start_codon:yes stop_codon:yes gene_type:complete
MRKVRITTNCNWAGTEQVHVIEVDESLSDDDINEIAYEMALEDHVPEGHFEDADDDEELTQ